MYFGSDRVMVGFSFFNVYESEPTRIRLKMWCRATCQLTESVPPAILIAPDNTLEAFGYDAEDKYKELMDDERHEKYHFFKNIVSLISNEHSVTHSIKDEMGRCLPSLLVLSMAIRFLSNDFVDNTEFNRYKNPLKMSDLYWVLTVPTTWSLETKELVKSAAEKADIKSDRFTILSDSDAAFHYCRHLSLTSKAGTESDVSRLPYEFGSRCLLIEADSSISIRVYKITINTQIQEGPLATCGGIELIKSKFDDLMRDIFSQNVYEKFKITKCDDYYDLMLTFEQKCLGHVTASGTDLTIITFPCQLLINMYEYITGEKIDKTNDSSPYKNKIRFYRDKMRVHTEAIVDCFDESIQNTIKEIEMIRRDKPIKAVVMIGRLSESTIFQNRIKSSYADSEIDIIIPRNPSIVVPQGAVMFGHSQQQPIEERRPATKLPSMK